MKTLTQKIAGALGIGKMPGDIKVRLEAEGPSILAESISVSITYRKFKAPGKRFHYKSSGAVGSIGVSSIRVVGYMFSKCVISIPLDDPKLASVSFKADKPGCLTASFDASVFNEKHSGKIELKFHFPDAVEAAERLNSHIK